jgi:signal transduction protein with GAF and PtsI domain
VSNITAWQCIEPEVTVKGPMQWMRLMMMILCGMTVKRMGMLGVSVRKIKAMPVKMERVTLIGKVRQNVT